MGRPERVYTSVAVFASFLWARAVCSSDLHSRSTFPVDEQAKVISMSTRVASPHTLFSVARPMLSQPLHRRLQEAALAVTPSPEQPNATDTGDSTGADSLTVTVTTDNAGPGDAGELVCEPGCLHGGICQLDPQTKAPSCMCPLPDPTTGSYFRGSSCQTEAIRCNATWWCENGGTCTPDPSESDLFSCTCPPKFQVTHLPYSLSALAFQSRHLLLQDLTRCTASQSASNLLNLNFNS